MAEWGVSTLNIARTIGRVDDMAAPFGDGAKYAVRAGEDLDYAVWVEFGTSSHGPQPFMRPAFAKARSRLREVAIRTYARGTDPDEFGKEVVRQLAYIAFAEAQDKVPVNTGTLKESIEVERIE